MNEHFKPEVRSTNRPEDAESPPANPRPNGHSQPKHQSNGHSSSPPVDFWTFTDVMANRWHWLVIGGILGAAAFFVLGWLFLIKPKFTATVQLLRYENPTAGGSLGTAPLTPETFAALIVSPDLLREVGAKVNPPIPPERLVKQMKVDP